MVKKNYDDMLSRFHLIPERYGRTDRFAISIARVSMLTRDKYSSVRDKIMLKILWLCFCGHSVESFVLDLCRSTWTSNLNIVERNQILVSLFAVWFSVLHRLILVFSTKALDSQPPPP